MGNGSEETFSQRTNTNSQQGDEKEKDGFLGQDILLGERTSTGLYHAGCLFFLRDEEGPYEKSPHSVQFSSVAQSCPTLCDPMNRSTPGLPVHHWLPEFTQTHVHRVGDAIQPSHPLSSPFPPTPNPSKHQSLFQWVNSSHEMAKV